METYSIGARRLDGSAVTASYNRFVFVIPILCSTIFAVQILPFTSSTAYQEQYSADQIKLSYFVKVQLCKYSTRIVVYSMYPALPHRGIRLPKSISTGILKPSPSIALHNTLFHLQYHTIISLKCATITVQSLPPSSPLQLPKNPNFRLGLA